MTETPFILFKWRLAKTVIDLLSEVDKNCIIIFTVKFLIKKLHGPFDGIPFCHCSTCDIKGEKYPDRQRDDACTKQKHGRFQLVAPEPLGKLEEWGSQRVWGCK